MIEYSYDPPYNQWSGNRSDTLNKWKVNYKGSIATASALPNKGEFKGDTYNVLEDGSNYMWNGNSWDKLDANVYVGATSSKSGIQGLVPPASSSERYKFLRGDSTYKDVTWNAVTEKPSTYPPSEHTHLWEDITDKPSTFTPSEHSHQDLQDQIDALTARIEALETPAELEP